jgi:hypothetical protein
MNTNRGDSNMNTRTLNQVKDFTGRNTWNVVCPCNKAHKQNVIVLNIDHYFKLLDAYGVEFGDTRQLNRFNHKMLNF